MKAVLISIQPKWCEKIANGEKTIEVRKSRPKLETPFKVYIYCTKAKEMHHNGCIVWHEDSLFSADKGEIKYGSSLELWGNNYEHGAIFNGKVIGEFVCDRIDELPCGVNKPYWLKEKTCITNEHYKEYLGNKNGYGWHISDIKIYDKPKELSEFKSVKVIRRYHKKEYDKYEKLSHSHRVQVAYFDRPPQSWCYVEEK